MPLISILTTLYAPSSTSLSETIGHVGGQKLPPDWELEWVLQEDGAEPKLGDYFEDIPYARYEANRQQMGPAVTRNLGLSRVRGDIVQVLDHDDVLLPHALATLLPIFEDGSIYWAVGQADDLLPNGERMGFESAMPYGRIRAGAVNDWAIAHGGNWPIHCAGLMMRTALLRAIGGYTAIPFDDDIAMFAAFSEIADGYNEPTITWLYRIHPLQLHKSEMWKPRNEEGRRIALERAVALRRSPLRLDPSIERPIPSAINVGPLVPEKLRHENVPTNG
jgi:glycosyltransferase involved in cell wall biosynthesis